MGDRMHPMSFGELVKRISKGYRKTGQILGVDPVSLAGRKGIPIFGGKIETPFGPAAGPNTQLAGNLVAAYAAGARFFELKTVQKMDGEELAKCVARPCILAYDEGYNVEWSTELTVIDAAAEYIRGWWAIKLLAKELDLGDPDGFVFNMSVGYDLAGIKLPISSITTSNMSSFSVLLIRIIDTTDLNSSERSYSCSTRCILPDSILDISRRSFIRPSKDSDAFLMSRAYFVTSVL